MDGEFLTQSPKGNLSTNAEGSEGVIRPNSPYPYTEAFYQQFPYYLSIGMTAEQYWDDDATLAYYYRKAEEIRKERVNQEMWLQGMYIYDAISRLTPVLHAFAKKGTKPQPYVEEPYAVSKKTAMDAEERKAKAKSEKGRRFMEAIMAQNNKRFEKNAQDNKEGR